MFRAVGGVCCLSLLWAIVIAQSAPQLHITGTVAIVDGRPLPSAVKVNLKCHGSVLQSVFTSPGEARFSFRITQRTNSSAPGSNTRPDGGMDASIGGPTISPDLDRRGQRGNIAFKRTDLSHCVCEATLAGYRSDAIRLGVRSPFDDPDIGFITLYPLEEVRGTTVSVTTAGAPDKAAELFEKARKELSEKNPDRAKMITHLEQATETYPAFSEAWQFLAEVHLAEGNEAESRLAFRKAIEADPVYLPPYGALAELELRGGKNEEAARLTEKALELNPHVMSTQYIHSIAHYYLGNLEKAVEAIEKIHDSSEAARFPATHRILGSIYAEQRRYQEAAAEFQRFLETNPPDQEAADVRNTLETWKQSGLLPSTVTGTN